MSYEAIEQQAKGAVWENIKKRIDRTVDKLKEPIDEGIKESIIGLQAFEIWTSASCEGHLDHGVAAPWIDIESREAEGLEEQLSELRERVRKEERKPTDTEKTIEGDILKNIEKINLEERKKLMPLLDEFYKNRQTPYDVRLIIEPRGWGWSQLSNQGAGLQKIENTAEKEKKLKEYQKEMNMFAAFLKEKYFQE